MHKGMRWGMGLAAACVLMAVGAGCQTYFPYTGQTLPSGYYQKHPPQFIPKSPQFPLNNELESLLKASSSTSPAGPVPGAPPTPPFVP